MKRKPEWLKIPMPGKGHYTEVKQLIEQRQLHTVCQSARCPNRNECWSRRTATFMIMGDICSRHCGFCAVEFGSPLPLKADEPTRIADAVCSLQLEYAVITSVTRDDLVDGGAGHFSRTIRAVRARNPQCRIEVLIPDFQGCWESLDTILDAKPDVVNHNVETVPRLYTQVRPQADFDRSVSLLKKAHAAGVVTKSGVMIGLGESIDEIMSTAEVLLQAGCNILTVGQYLPPSQRHIPVVRFAAPEEFAELKRRLEKMGFSHVEASPLVRSSYHADEQKPSSYDKNGR